MTLDPSLLQATPDNWPEAVATIIIAVLSWWLGRKNANKKAPRRF